MCLFVNAATVLTGDLICLWEFVARMHFWMNNLLAIMIILVLIEISGEQWSVLPHRRFVYQAYWHREEKDARQTERKSDVCVCV